MRWQTFWDWHIALVGDEVKYVVRHPPGVPSGRWHAFAMVPGVTLADVARMSFLFEGRTWETLAAAKAAVESALGSTAAGRR